MFDHEGYAHDPVSRTTYFEPFGRSPLRERIITPGMRLRGWLAIKIPDNCTKERLQFITGYMSSKTAEFLLKQ